MTIPMIAYHGEAKIKRKYLSRIRAHAKADELLQSYGYWKNGKGCALGCCLHADAPHALYPTALGIPEELAYLEDHFFERLPLAVAKKWPARFLSAIKPGADLSRVYDLWSAWNLIDPIDGVITLVSDAYPDVQRIVRTRRTQTNEPARCATLLPLLCSLPQPLALLEIGASAGLCLLPDRYGYRYPDRTLRGGPPEFPCAVTGPAPLPDALPSVVWRRGLDLNPLSPTTDADWLRALVWPGQYERLARLEQALAIAVADPPEIVRGDLRTDLPALAATAPPDATLVVFHTAVLAYLARDERPAVADTIRATGARWIANEGPPVLRGWLPDAPDDGTEDFVLRLDGEPVARGAGRRRDAHRGGGVVEVHGAGGAVGEGELVARERQDDPHHEGRGREDGDGDRGRARGEGDGALHGQGDGREHGGETEAVGGQDHGAPRRAQALTLGAQ